MTRKQRGYAKLANNSETYTSQYKIEGTQYDKITKTWTVIARHHSTLRKVRLEMYKQKGMSTLKIGDLVSIQHCNQYCMGYLTANLPSFEKQVHYAGWDPTERYCGKRIR